MSEIYREICTHIKEADAILIGASNGLSITEGLHLFADNTAFDMLFGDMKQKIWFTLYFTGYGYPVAFRGRKMVLLEQIDPSLLQQISAYCCDE